MSPHLYMNVKISRSVAIFRNVFVNILCIPVMRLHLPIQTIVKSKNDYKFKTHIKNRAEPYGSALL